MAGQHPPMTYPHPRQPENIKVCPHCGTNLIHTAKHCAACGYRFISEVSAPEDGVAHLAARRKPLSLGAPFLAGLMILAFLGLLVLFTSGMQKREEARATVAAQQATGTYIATTYVSPTPSPTPTRTPAPPTETPVVDAEYTVASGDSCLSISKRFNVDIGTLLRKNDIDCALLKIGTVLRIPPPTPTPEPVYTATSKPAQ